MEKWIYSASSNARKVSGPKRGHVVDSAAVEFLGFRYRETSISPAQMELRQWQNLANAGSCSIYIMGRIDNHKDMSSFAGTKRVFHFHRNHEELYRGIESAAEVMLIHRNMMGRFDHEMNGWIRALTESHVPFDEMRQGELKSTDQLAGKKLAILCDAKMLNDQQAQVLDAFAENGGVVLVTGDTALMSAMQNPSAPFPLKCMGIKRIQEKRANLRSSVFMVEEKDREAFPHCMEASLIPFGENLVMAEFEEGTQKYLNLVGEHPYGPPEICYYTDADVTGHPGVTAFPYGKGKGVYLPWLAGTFYYEEGYQNTFQVMQDVLCNVCGARQIAPDLTPMVEVLVGKKGNQTVLQLINTSGVFSNSFFEPLPVYGIELHLPLDNAGETEEKQFGDTAAEAKAYNGGTATVRRTKTERIVTLDRLEAYEIILL